jgi:hypothetical protein
MMKVFPSLNRLFIFTLLCHLAVTPFRRAKRDYYYIQRANEQMRRQPMVTFILPVIAATEYQIKQ